MRQRKEILISKDCDSCCRGFEPHQPPQLKQALSPSLTAWAFCFLGWHAGSRFLKQHPADVGARRWDVASHDIDQPMVWGSVDGLGPATAMKHALAIRPKGRTVFDHRGSTNRLLLEPQRPDAHFCNHVRARVPVP